MNLAEFLRDSWVVVLMIVANLAILVAELWLLTVDGDPLLVAVLLAMTGMSLLTLMHTLWGDWR